jgi:uncharacterized protein YbaR (Trm112 family)
MIKIVCTSCQKPLSLDETKLPADKAVSFPCPVCKTKLSVDRRNLDASQGAAAAPEAQPQESAAADDMPPHDDDGFGTKALIVGNDSAPLRQAAKLVGFLPVHFAAPEKARDYFLQEFPPLVILNPAQLTPPPLQDFAPIVSLLPSDRRKTFLILVSDGLRTLDGNAAFLYGVNLVIAGKDLNMFQQIYREAHTYHERLYTSVTSVLKAMG